MRAKRIQLARFIKDGMDKSPRKDGMDEWVDFNQAILSVGAELKWTETSEES
jgi:hypothetical protein